MANTTGFDYSKIDVSSVKAGSVSLGTDAQDCALIARTFERGAHATPSEAAVWAPLSRMLANTKIFSLQASSSISDYIKTPQMAALELQKQAASLSSGSGMGAESTSPSKNSVDELLQGVGFGAFRTSMAGATKFGNVMSEWAKKCLPCSPIPSPAEVKDFVTGLPRPPTPDEVKAAGAAQRSQVKDAVTGLPRPPTPAEIKDGTAGSGSKGPVSPDGSPFTGRPGPPKPWNMGRMTSFLELNPSVAITRVLHQDIKDKLAILFSITDLLRKPPGSQKDMCDMVNALSPICPLDLQRMIATLMAQMMMDVPTMDGMMDLLGQLIGPIFSPILMQVTSLIDMFLQLITAPLRCVISQMELVTETFEQIDEASGGNTDLSSSIGEATGDVKKNLSDLQKASDGITTGLDELTTSMSAGIAQIGELAEFYTAEITGLLGEQGGNDSGLLGFTFKKLQKVRQIMFLIAMLRAKAAGHAICNKPKGKSPKKNELDNFFRIYINPDSPFDAWVGDDGRLHIGEKGSGDIGEKGSGDSKTAPLPKAENVLKFDGGGTIIDPAVAKITTDIALALSQPVDIITNCRFDTTEQQAKQIEKWMQEMKP